MKYLVLLIGSVILCVQISQSQTAEWAQKIGGNDGGEQSTSIALDSNGSVYVCGNFTSSSLRFTSSIELVNYDNKGINNSYDAFISKYNSSGICQWAHSISGSGTDFATRTAVDRLGNVYISGAFTSSNLSFNNGISLINSSSPYYNVYFAKYNSNGVCQWARKIDGENNGYEYNIALDDSSNIYITGNFTCDSLRFDNGKTLTNSGYSDVFIAKYNSNGMIIWVQKISGIYDDIVHNIAVDHSGNVFVTGGFASPDLSFNNGISLKDIINSTNRGHYDAYFTKYNTSGICQWAKKITGYLGLEYYTNNIAVDRSGNVYISGQLNPAFYDDTLNFNNNISLAKSNKYINFGYFAKFDIDGICIFAQKISERGDDFIRNIVLDSKDNLYIAVTMRRDVLSASGFIKYNSTGLLLWTKSINSSFCNLNNLDVDSSGNVFLTGDFKFSVDFNNSIRIENNDVNGYDVFLVKYGTSPDSLLDVMINIPDTTINISTEQINSLIIPVTITSVSSLFSEIIKPTNATVYYHFSKYIFCPDKQTFTDKGETRYYSINQDFEPKAGAILSYLRGTALIGDVSSAIFIDSIQWNTGQNISYKVKQGSLSLNGLCVKGGIRLVRAGSAQIQSISPNPNNGEIQAVIECSKAMEGNIEIYSMIGSLVDKARIRLNEGENRISIKLNYDITNGIYRLMLSTNQSTDSKLIIIQK